MALTPFVIDDFSGGITDFATDAEKNQYVKADNILIERSTNAFNRYGSLLFNDSFDRPYTFDGLVNTPITTRISSLWNFDEDTNLIATNAKKAFRDDAILGYTELKGPDGNDFFSKGDESSRIYGGMWKGHLLLLNDSDANPMKIYRDQTGNFKAVQAGLPRYLTPIFYDNTVATDEIVALANDLKNQFLAHFADVVAHPTAADTVAAADITAPDLINGDSLATTIELVNELIKAYTDHYQDLALAIGGRAYHSNILPTTLSASPNFRLESQDAPTSFLECAQRLNDLKRKFNWHVRSFMGHPSVTTVSTAATLLNTDTGPLFTDVDYSALITIANELKRVFNLHLGSVASGVHTAEAHLFDDNLSTSNDFQTDFSGAIDTDNIITLADATDKDSLIELISHIYAAYRNHQFDAALPVIYLLGDTDHVNTNQVKNITAFQTQTATGTLANVTVGMFLGYGASTDAWNKGTKVQSIDVPNAVITLDQNHNSGGAQSGKAFFFSKRKWHSIGQPSTDTLNLTNLDPLVSPDLMLSDDASILTVLYELALKYNAHDASGFPLGQATTLPLTTYPLHYFGSTSQLIYDKTLVFKRYNYAFIFSYEYKTIGGETFKDLSAPLYKTKVSLKSIEDVPSNITKLSSVLNTNFNLQTLQYETFGNYDTTNMKVEIYRSKDAGSVLRKAGEVPNGTQTFTDAMSDNVLQGQENLYTSGGVLDNDPPPRAKFLHITQNNTAYYGNTTRTLNDGTIESIPQRVEQSVINDPDSVPAGNFIDLPLAVKGLSSVRTVPIVWTEEATYRIEGSFNEIGQGVVSAVTISDRVGLVGSSSPVQIDGAVVFAGPDQFYMTDGYQMIAIGRSWPYTYQKLISNDTRRNNIIGTFDKTANRVWLGCSQNSDENDSAFILDLNFPNRGKTGLPFTTASNGDSFAPTAFCMFKNQLIRGDSRGYIFKHDFNYRDDPKIDVTKPGNQWEKKVPIYSLKSIAFDMESPAIRKWASLIQIKFDNTGDFSLQINSDNDIGRVAGALSPIRVRGKTSEIDERRYFPKGSLFFGIKQIELTNAFVGITNSDTLGLATVDPVLKTITLAIGNWPSGFVDYVVALVNDGYVEQYTITQQVGATLVVSDPSNLLPAAGSYKWVVRGFPKGEKFQVHEYAIWTQGMGINQTTAAAESGENA